MLEYHGSSVGCGVWIECVLFDRMRTSNTYGCALMQVQPLIGDFDIRDNIRRNRRPPCVRDELKKNRRPITKTNLKVFDNKIHQKLATDVIGVSFDAQ